MTIKAHSLFASAAAAAVFAFTAPAHAQLVGGALDGAAGGTVGGTLGGGLLGPVPAGGAIDGSGWGAMNGSLAGTSDGLRDVHRAAGAGNSAAHRITSSAAQRGGALKGDVASLGGKARNAAVNTAQATSGTAAGSASGTAAGPASGADPILASGTAAGGLGGTLAGAGQTDASRPSPSNTRSTGLAHGSKTGSSGPAEHANPPAAQGSSSMSGQAGVSQQPSASASGSASAEGGASAGASIQH